MINHTMSDNPEKRTVNSNVSRKMILGYKQWHWKVPFLILQCCFSNTEMFVFPELSLQIEGVVRSEMVENFTLEIFPALWCCVY